MDMQQAAAMALKQGGQQQPQPGAAPPPAGGAPQGQQGGGLAQLAQAYGRCEQTGNCTPQDLQILQQGLPNLMKMAQNIQKIIQIASQGGGQQQPQSGAQGQ